MNPQDIYSIDVWGPIERAAEAATYVSALAEGAEDE